MSTPYPSDCQVRAGLRENARKRVSTEIDDRVAERAKPLRLLLLDVDGVLTNGTLFFSSDGIEIKGFNTQDGFGLTLLRQSGIDLGVITARHSEAVAKRCADLQMRFVYQGERNKAEALRSILQQSGLRPFEVGYMGDDWLDLALFNRVGFSAAPSNAVNEVRQAAHFVSAFKGGKGAVREVCEVILKAQGIYEKTLNGYQKR